MSSIMSVRTPVLRHWSQHARTHDRGPLAMRSPLLCQQRPTCVRQARMVLPWNTACHNIAIACKAMTQAHTPVCQYPPKIAMIDERPMEPKSSRVHSKAVSGALLTCQACNSMCTRSVQVTAKCMKQQLKPESAE